MPEANISNIGNQFLQGIDRYLADNYLNLKCADIPNMYFQFTRSLKKFKGNSNGFTGLSEYLIFRFLYHWLGGEFERKDIPGSQDLSEFISKHNNNLRIGQSVPVSLNGQRCNPDIVIYESGRLVAAVEIKIYFSGGVKQIARERERLEKLRKCYPEAQVLWIVLWKLSTKGKILSALKEMKKGRQWFNFLNLEPNNEPFGSELQKYLDLERLRFTSSEQEALNKS